MNILELLDKIGTALIIYEKMMNDATFLVACGTAYSLRYIRAAMQEEIEIGFDANIALAIASQTVGGTVKMTLEEKIHP